MGPQRVLQAAVVAVVATGVAAAAPKKLHERVAVIDLGPASPSVRQQLAAVLADAGLDPVLEDNALDALAGDDSDTDATELAAAMARAQAAFGKLDCVAASEASAVAIGIAAQRQAAGLAVPELQRALAYTLLCADRAGDVDHALVAAARLRTAGGSADVPPEVWKKYPEIDVIPDRELVPLTITTDAKDADVWIDFARVGKAPATVHLPVGDHVIAVAAGSRRGWAAGTAVRTQSQLAVPAPDRSGPWSEVARKIASWKGKPPAPADLGFVLGKTRARVALVRRGDSVEVYGRLGLAEPVRRLGGDDGVAPIAEANRLAALIVDRVQGWNDRAPDPDRPLLVDDQHGEKKNARTKWWVYASILGAVAAGAVIIYSEDAGSDRQRVELHQP